MKKTPDSPTNDTWAVVELMGHITLAGRVTKPGEYGALWQIDIPEKESYRTEFFGSQSVYRIRIVSETIARAFSRPGHEILEYDTPIVSREEHLDAMNKARERYHQLYDEKENLLHELNKLKALPAGDSDDE